MKNLRDKIIDPYLLFKNTQKELSYKLYIVEIDHIISNVNQSLFITPLKS